MSEESLLEKFEERRKRIIKDLESLYSGHFDPEDAAKSAALCLLAQETLSRLQVAAEAEARNLKQDIKFAMGEAYVDLKLNGYKGPDGKEMTKLTDSGITNLTNIDPSVVSAIKAHSESEKEAKELSSLVDWLKDSHILFRGFHKRDV